MVAPALGREYHTPAYLRLTNLVQRRHDLPVAADAVREMTKAMSPAEVHLRQACAELDRSLRSGAQCRAEDLLHRFPVLASSAELAVELIYTELVTREDLGERPEAGEYYSRFPQWQQELCKQLHVHNLLSEPTLMLGAERGASEGGGSNESAGRYLGPYELLEELARGNMGVVFRARHRTLNRIVALKRVRAGANASLLELRRFRIEAEAIARLQHPHIVQIYEVGETEEGPFLALELVEGVSLAQHLGSRPLGARAAAVLIETLARAIHHAHGLGILHRDLKPANILLTPQGVPKITDFGLAKLLDQQDGHTETGAIFGTPSYMAPEQAESGTGTIGPGVDIYALGAILYELLTGTPPFRGETVLQTLQRVVSEEPVPADRLQSGVPRDLATICMKCLQKEPARRYPSAAALADDLARFQAGRPIRARRAGLVERIGKWARRSPGVAGLVAALMAAVVTVLLGALWYHTRLCLAVEEADRERNEARRGADIARRKEDEAQKAAREALRQKTEAQRQSELAGQRLATLRQWAYTLQLNQVEERWRLGSTDALSMLEDPERCPVDLRDFSWGLYHHLARQHQALVTRHDRGISSLAFSPESGWLAVAGGEECTVSVWRPGDDAPVFTLTGHHGPVTCVIYSPDGQLLATGSGDHLVRLWDAATSHLVATLRGHEAGVQALAFSPDGRTLASGSADHTARLWDVSSGKELSILRGHAATLTALVFSPDGRRLVTGSVDGIVRLWDPVTSDGNRERGFLKRGEQEPVRCMAFSTDGKHIAISGGRRAAIDLFDASSLVLVTSLWGHLDQIHALAFSANSKVLASGSADGTVRFWEMRTGVQRLTLQGDPEGVHAVAFSPDGQLAASAGTERRVHLWDLRSRSLIQPSDRERSSGSRIVCLAYSPDGRQVVTGSHDGGLCLWDAATGQESARWRAHQDIIWSLAFSRDGRTLASAGEDGRVRLWDVPTRRCLATLAGYKERVRCLAFHPDGQTLATTDEKGSIHLWNVSTQHEQRLEALGAATYAVGFSPDGTTLAAGDARGRVILWDVATQRRRVVWTPHHRAVLFTVFSPDGRTLATGGMDNRILLWGPDEQVVRAELPWHAGYVFSAAFTPDSRTLAAGGGSRVGHSVPGEVKLWNVATGQCRGSLPRSCGPVGFAPDGGALATVAACTSLQVWEADPCSGAANPLVDR